jgi:hypothetical protein
VCPKCGKTEPLAAFAKDSEFCRECSHVPFWKKIDPSLVGIVAIIAVIGIVSWMLISNYHRAETVASASDVDTVDIIGERFQEALEDGRLWDAYQCLQNQVNNDSVEWIKTKFTEGATNAIFDNAGEAENSLANYLGRDNIRNLVGIFSTRDLYITAARLDALSQSVNDALNKTSGISQEDKKKLIKSIDEFKQDIGRDAGLLEKAQSIKQTQGTTSKSNPDTNLNRQKEEEQIVTTPKLIKIYPSDKNGNHTDDPVIHDINNPVIDIYITKYYDIVSDVDIDYNSDYSKYFRRFRDTKKLLASSTIRITAEINIGDKKYKVNFK